MDTNSNHIKTYSSCVRCLLISVICQFFLFIVWLINQSPVQYSVILMSIIVILMSIIVVYEVFVTRSFSFWCFAIYMTEDFCRYFVYDVI